MGCHATGCPSSAPHAVLAVRCVASCGCACVSSLPLASCYQEGRHGERWWPVAQQHVPCQVEHLDQVVHAHVPCGVGRSVTGVSQRACQRAPLMLTANHVSPTTTHSTPDRYHCIGVGQGPHWRCVAARTAHSTYRCLRGRGQPLTPTACGAACYDSHHRRRTRSRHVHGARCGGRAPAGHQDFRAYCRHRGRRAVHCVCFPQPVDWAWPVNANAYERWWGRMSRALVARRSGGRR